LIKLRKRKKQDDEYSKGKKHVETYLNGKELALGMINCLIERITAVGRKKGNQVQISGEITTEADYITSVCIQWINSCHNRIRLFKAGKRLYFSGELH
jgi:hypothetical protein